MTELNAGPVPAGYAPIADVRDPADGRYVPVRSPRGQEILAELVVAHNATILASNPVDLHNTIAREGVDRCFCGSKYWEHDKCIDCGTHVSRLSTRVYLTPQS